MNQLDPAQYEAVLPLVARSRIDGYSSYAFAVLEGRQPGHVFTDDAEKPQSALVIHLGQPSLLCGKTDPNSGSFYEQLPDCVAGGRTPLFWTTSDNWHQVLASLPSTPLRRTIFRYLPEQAPLADETLPGGFQVKRLDEALLEAVSATFQRADRRSSMSFWGGPAGFVRDSFGFCAVRDGQVGSYCVAAFIGGGAAEVDIATEEKFQRQGLAAATGRVFIRHCLAHGLRPDWSCRSDNLASAVLAAKLGFGKLQEITGYLLHGE